MWAKLIEALADLGYDANNIVRALLYHRWHMGQGYAIMVCCFTYGTAVVRAHTKCTHGGYCKSQL